MKPNKWKPLTKHGPREAVRGVACHAPAFEITPLGAENVELRAKLKTLADQNAGLLKDRERMDWLCKHTQFRFSVYDSTERKHLPENLAQGVVIRPVIDAAMAKHPNP